MDFLMTRQALPVPANADTPSVSGQGVASALGGGFGLVGASEGALTRGPNSQEVAGLLWQAAPHVQQTATSYRIGQSKAPTSISHPAVALAKIASLNTSNHYTTLRRQQGKLVREGSVKLVAYFFLTRSGNETAAPEHVSYTTVHIFLPVLSLTLLQITAVSAIQHFALITPISQAFQETFVLVREALRGVFPALNVDKLSTSVSICFYHHLMPNSDLKLAGLRCHMHSMCRRHSLGHLPSLNSRRLVFLWTSFLLKSAPCS